MMFVRTSLVNLLSDVRTGYVGSGLLGRLGNKGGVGISTRIGRHSFAFVNVHLAAHTEYVRRRNADASNVVENLFRAEKGRNATVCFERERCV
jgi:phosphatidylinositol-bisphosphatase